MAKASQIDPSLELQLELECLRISMGLHERQAGGRPLDPAGMQIDAAELADYVRGRLGWTPGVAFRPREVARQ